MKKVRVLPDKRGGSEAYINIRDVYTKDMQLDYTLAYTSEALHIAENIHDSSSLSVSLSNLGDIYVKKKAPLAALDYFKRALQLSEAIHDPDGISYTHHSMAEAYHLLGRYKESIHY